MICEEVSCVVVNNAIADNEVAAQLLSDLNKEIREERVREERKDNP